MKEQKAKLWHFKSWTCLGSCNPLVRFGAQLTISKEYFLLCSVLTTISNPHSVENVGLWYVILSLFCHIWRWGWHIWRLCWLVWVVKLGFEFYCLLFSSSKAFVANVIASWECICQVKTLNKAKNRNDMSLKTQFRSNWGISKKHLLKINFLSMLKLYIKISGYGDEWSAPSMWGNN